MLSYADAESGFILSGALVKDFAVVHKGTAAKFDWRARLSQSGESMMADAMNEVSQIKVTDVSPMLQKESQLGFAFAEDNWCKSVISLSQMSAKEVKALYDYERTHGFATMLFRDLFATSFPGGLPSRADDWEPAVSKTGAP